LRLAASERRRLRRHLLVAAALREVLAQEPVVVGGTAEEYHSAAEYHETDLDVCAPLSANDKVLLAQLGFARHGRHWFHEASKVAVEFPDTRIDGDDGRVERFRVSTGTVAMIGLDDLYLDRLRQATAPFHPDTSIEFASALAVAAACFDRIDRRYVLRRIGAIEASEPDIGSKMRALDSKIRRRVRRSFVRPSR